MDVAMSRSRKADISIGLMLVLFVAVISVAMLVGLFATKLPGFSKSLYCKTFYHVYSATFVPKGLRVDKSYCVEEQVLRVDLITNSTFGGGSGGDLKSLVNLSITAYAFACWKETEYGRLTKPLLCYELTTPASMPEVTVKEEDVANILLENGLCDILPDNDVNPDCGTENRLDFPYDDITVKGRSNILIEYNGSVILVS
ncbi:hypothetical protein JW968_05115 [Candidatus Woesearchaeota archaeon]|nr:hypothetical protein [Candidatus Woesearchaeota archaeon]